MTVFVRKLKWGAILILGLLFMLAGSSFAFAAEKQEPEKVYLSDVYKTMLDVKSLQYVLTFDVETPIGSFQAEINGKAQETPLRVDNNISIQYRDLQNKEKNIRLKQYVEENEGNLIGYVLEDGKWVKQTIPFNPAFNQKLSKDEIAAAQESMLQLIKAVELQRETPSYKYMEVTLDTIRIGETIAAALKQGNVPQDDDVVKAVAMLRLGLAAAGDLKYTVTVDKATKMVKAAEMNLTETIQKSAGLFLDIANPKERASIEDFLSKSTLKMQIEYSNYNHISPIEIPQSVRDDAVEAKPAGVATPKQGE